MDANQRSSIVLAAIHAAGPRESGHDAEWERQVVENAKSIFLMLDEHSGPAKALATLETCKVFTGAITDIKPEESSKRGLVTVFTGTSRTFPNLPAGFETFRTQRFDGPNGRQQYMEVFNLVGHRVMIWLDMEQKGDLKYRTLFHLRDLGLSTEPAAIDALNRKQAAMDARQANPAA